MALSEIIFAGEHPIVKTNELVSIPYDETIRGHYYIGYHLINNNPYISLFKQGEYQINATLQTYCEGPMWYMNTTTRATTEIYPASTSMKEWLNRCNNAGRYLAIDEEDNSLWPKDLVKDLKDIHDALSGYKVELKNAMLPNIGDYTGSDAIFIDPSDMDSTVVDWYREQKAKGLINEDLTHKRKTNDKEKSKDTRALEQRESTRGGTIKARSKRSRATIKSGSIPSGKGPTRR